MINIYEYFLSSLPEENQKIITSFLHDCKKMDSYDNCTSIINKYNLSNSKFVNTKILNISFKNISCEISLSHEGDVVNSGYMGSAVSFSLINKIDSLKTLNLSFECNILRNAVGYAIKIYIVDNNNDKIFESCFAEFNGEIVMNEKISDRLVVKNSSDICISKNPEAMITILKHLPYPENYEDNILLFDDIDIKGNFFIQELFKASLLIKNNR